MEFNVSAKFNNKWWTFGRIKKNQYGNLQLSFKNTPDLKKLVNEGGEWLNFSLFEPREKDAKPVEKPAPATTTFDDSQEIPF